MEPNPEVKTLKLRMAKASAFDIERSILLCDALGLVRDGWNPDPDLPEEREFDLGNAKDCQEVLQYLVKLFRSSGLARVVFGMSALCDPKNEIVDPDSDVLKLHPRFEVPS